MENVKNLHFIRELSVAIRQDSPLIQVIIGPRQVGKTTTTIDFLESHFKDDYIYESADAVFNSNLEWLMSIWLKAHQENKILVVDEIQKIENWSEVVKKLWDKDKKNKKLLKVILLGSSSLHIQKGLTESLTGRFNLIKAFHWNYSESNEGYHLTFDDFLKFGGYPGSYQYKKNEWVNYVKNSIVQTVIEKDILIYQNVKSPALFRQAFEIIISYPAQEISYTKLLGQIQNKGNVELIKNYLALYEGACLIKILEKFSDKKIKVKSSSPKILPLAPALYYLNILDEYNTEEKGHVFELIVGAMLVRLDMEIYYWREGDHEVDFILKNGRSIFAIEVKSGRRKRGAGISKFCELYTRAKAIFITPENYIEFEKNPIQFLER